MTTTGNGNAPLIVFGAGQTAEAVAYYLENAAGRKIAAFVVDDDRVAAETFQGRPVLAMSELASAFPPQDHEAFCAISFAGLNRPRAEKVATLKGLGYRMTRFVHPAAHVPGSVPIGENSLVLENNVIQPGCSIGDNTFLWSGNHVGHHTAIGNHCYIASHVVISGAVTVGDYCFIGVNCTIRDNISIGRMNVLGAATVILSDTEDEQVFKAEATRPSRVPSSRLRRI